MQERCSALKTLFVVDTPSSALHTSAYEWSKVIEGEILSATNYYSLKHLLRDISSKKPELVIFSWRQLLDLVFLSPSNLELFKTLTADSQILALIADHSAEDSSRFEKDNRLAQVGVGLVPVTNRLFDFYTSRDLHPFGILPDRPDINLIRSVRSECKSKVPNSIIWVGNSKWGKRHGFVDHKGLNLKYRPFLKLAQSSGIQFVSVIIDSASQRKTQQEVLRNLASSEVLIVTSTSEGTGLPILEALGVGTNVLTTDVGVVREFPAVKIVAADAEPREYLDAFVEWRKNRVSSEQCISEFERYMSRIDNSWQLLIEKVRFSPNPQQNQLDLLEVGSKRVINLLFWNLKFLLKWIRFCYDK